jgi:hypothetical protein
VTRNDLLLQTVAAWRPLCHLTLGDAAVLLGVHRTTLARRLREAAQCGLEVPDPQNALSVVNGALRDEAANDEQIEVAFAPGKETGLIEIPAMPAADLPPEEIVRQRIKEFEQKDAWEKANKLIQIKVKVPGPLGIWWFGDPHLDDDGTDIGAAFKHAEMTAKYPFVFGANIGDTTNNWVGRLSRLYANQNMGRSRALSVAEHWIKTAKWLLFLDGNHDCWSGDDNPLNWIMAGCGGLHRPDGARIQLNLPFGVEPVRIHARHDFPGHSMWNPGHGPMKSFRLGTRDHIKISGHKHESFETTLKCPETGIAAHIIKVASYKRHDRYAKQLDLPDQSLSPGCMTVIRPELAATHPDKIKVFWDADEGVDFLLYSRKKAGLPA